MVQIRGFTTIKSLVDNAFGEVATLGELSEESRTYSRDITDYYLDSNKDFAYHCMQRVDAANNNIDIPKEFLDDILAFSAWLVVAGKNGTITSDRETFLNEWIQTFPNMADEYDCGQMRTEGSYFLPERCIWHKGNNVIELFLADDAMQSHWMPWEIVVVPPVDNLDDLLLSKVEVQPTIQSRTTTTLFELMNVAKGDQPYTANKNEVLQWYQLSDSNQTMPTDWALLQYGPNARSAENVRIAIRDYILLHSASDETEWFNVYPDLFDPVLFYITPLWDNVAISSKLTTEGIYSPVVLYPRDIAKVKLFTPYSEEHIESNNEFFPTRFNCVTFAAVGSERNKEGTERLSNVYPQYLSVAMGNTDFYRQDLETQNWQKEIMELIKAAEKYRPNDYLPADITPTIRSGIVYLSTKIDGANYIVVTKESYINITDTGGSEIGRPITPS